MHRLLTILFLFAALTASAQQMPERREVRRGNRLYNRGDYTTAVERYARALVYNPGSFEAAYDLGNALYKSEWFDKAEEMMTRAATDSLRTDADRAEAFYNLGNAQFQQQKYKEALESYRRSLLLDPDDIEAKYNYAYTKKLLEQQQNDENQNGGRGDGNDDQQAQNQEQNQQNSDKQDDSSGDNEPSADPQQGEGSPNSGNGEQDNDDRQHGEQPLPTGISEQEQEQMLDAIQAQEDKTQDKLKEKQGVIVRGRKNW